MDIIVAMNGIKHTLNKKTQDLNRAFAGLKIIEEQLTTCKKIREEKDKNNRPDILKVHIFENEFIFNGELYSSGMKVREHTDGKRFYDEVAIKKSSRLARGHTQNSELGISGREDNKIDGNRSPS